jgi:hypothetical protein
VKKTHYAYSLELLKKVESARYAGPLTVEGIVANLNSCLTNSPTYSINAEAFAIHGANYRHDVLNDVFTRIGFESFTDKLSKTLPFSERIKLVEGISLNQEINLKPTESYRILNSLAEARNAVAHGVTSSILSNPTLIEYCEFIRDMCFSIHKLLDDNVKMLHVAKRCTCLGRPVDVFPAHNAIVVKSKNQAVAVGDTIRGVRNGEVTEAIIKSIQIQGSPIVSYDGSADIELGFQLDKMLTKKHRIFL